MSGSSGSGSNVIREFLVGLGVEINSTDIRKFTSSVDTMTYAVVKFETRMLSMASHLASALQHVAEALENMQYVALRAGTTVENLKTLQFAMSQVGLSAQDANAALESLAGALRINPGNESLLKYLGVATRDVKGNMRDTAAVMGDFLARLSKLPFYVAAQYAEMLGINAKTLFMLLQNRQELANQQERYREIIKATGVDLNASGRASVEFMRSIRETTAIIDAMWMKVSTVLMNQLRPQIDAFNKFLLAHAKEIEGLGISIGKALIGVGDSFVKILPDIMKLVDKTIEWKGVLGLIGDIIVYRIFGPIGLALWLAKQLYDLNKKNQEERHAVPGVKNPTPQQKQEHERRLEQTDEERKKAIEEQMRQDAEELRKRFTQLPPGYVEPGTENTDIAPRIDLGRMLFELLRRGAIELKELQGIPPPYQQQSGSGFNSAFVHPAAYSTFDNVSPQARSDMRVLADQFWAAFLIAMKEAMEALSIRPDGSTSGGGGGMPGVQSAAYYPGGAPSGDLNKRASWLMSNLMRDLGLTQAQAAGVASNFAAESGISNIVATGGDYGLAQWVGSRKKQLFAWAQANRLDPSNLSNQYQFFLKELTTQYPGILAALRGASTAEGAAQAFFPYESGGSAALEHHRADHAARAGQFNRYFMGGANAPRVGGGSPTLNNKTDIHVSGNDPIGTATEVQRLQDRINSSLVRDFRTAVIG